jgi:preprotein translocase SecE subunit
MKSTPRSKPVPAAAAARPARAAGAPNGRAFAEGVIAEMRRVTWPSQKEWVGATILTVALVVGVGFYTWGLDKIFGWVFSWITGTAR